MTVAANADTYTLTSDLSGSGWPRRAQISRAGGRIEPLAPQFVYVDVGLWAGSPHGGPQQPKRNFALIYNNWAAQCDFVSAGRGSFRAEGDNRSIYANNVKPRATFDRFLASDENFEREVGPLNRLLHVLAGPGDDKRVNVTKVMRYLGGAARADTERVYLFLPDMHIPLLQRQAGQSGAEELRPFGRMHFGSSGDSYQSREWFSDYERADIWGGGAAGADLIELLSRVERFSGGQEIHIVQLGDMIELWMGLQCFFENTVDHEVRPRSELGMSANEFVTHWLARAMGNQPPGERDLIVNGDMNVRVIQRMAAMANKTFIYGNHDCYFSPRAGLPGADAVGGARVGHFRSGDGRIFAEHGHQGDPANRDGAQMGHSVTNNIAFGHPELRSYEHYVNDARAVALEFAGRRFIAAAREGRYYAFYVMGHTHIAGLATVMMQHQSE